eukprot:gene20428-14964_t
MSLVQFYHQAFDATTQFFASGLALIHLRPKQYATLFPPLVTMEKIYSLIDEGKFPVLEQLAPAFTYCIILSIIRYLLQNFLMVPLAEWSMQIKSVPFVPIKEVDKSLPFKGAKTADVENVCKKTGRQTADVKKYLTLRKKYHVNKKKI